MITTEYRNRIIEAMQRDTARYNTQSQQAKAYGISPSQLSNILKGHLDGILSDKNWGAIAIRLGIHRNPDQAWNTAKTPVFNYIYRQLSVCQDKSISGLLCDSADIGKTYTAKVYVRENKNAVYIDCSQYKTKTHLVKKIAKEFGIDYGGLYKPIFDDLVLILKSFTYPLIVLDEAGDLTYEAFLELKALWNATEYHCGWYMMGADSLKVKINRNIESKRVGYAELFSRYGTKYQKITPNGIEELHKFKMRQIKVIAEANNIQLEFKELFAKSGGSLRRLYIMVKKGLNTNKELAQRGSQQKL